MTTQNAAAGLREKADKYTEFVSRGFGKDLAKRLGLPQPVILRRYSPQAPLVDGPILVLGQGAGADGVAKVLLDWHQDVRRHATPKEKLGAIVAVLDELGHPEQLSETMLTIGAALRDLNKNARVVTISRPAVAADAPAIAAARNGIDGIVRSLAKELRAGATANGILLANGVSAADPSAVSTLRFFLSGRSAFVDGQFLTASSAGLSEQPDWAKPLQGSVAVVTGAARGIGAAIARTLARDGATVIAVDVPAAGDHLAAVANEIRGTALQLDITNVDAGQRILEHARQRYGRLDIVVHNAGITRDKLLANMDNAKWDSVIAVNIASQLRMNEAFLASNDFVTNPRIISVASTSGIAGNRGQTNYAASKAGVIGMVRSTAPMLAERGGTVNAVAPGFIETDMTAKIPFATREVARRLNSLQQGGRPTDVAEAIAFFAQPAAAGVTANILRVCGQNLVGQ
ncbi:3-oxoacyl-[acyl-carrier protein] reductase [Arthrobacter alpinus]|uniref:3-oxoacyl-[acyl-carrier protein] reductase n=1 Tax=Arthrobacter alpinus TaxID=656366 RepID=A0A1H5J143_9MICC|nr:3-oxoacyl-ACP reductase [Arthrobacter alpinus]SEE46134.1 3-oxoacyl-[acyl-carrier protein] reductase [Arthrobacter alpinus]